MKRFNKKDLFTIPNLMGYFRILLIPVFCYFYIKKQAYLLAAGIVLISSLTDLFDGYIARRFSLSCIPLSAHVGAAGSDGSQRGIHGDHGTLFSEKR